MRRSIRLPIALLAVAALAGGLRAARPAPTWTFAPGGRGDARAGRGALERSARRRSRRRRGAAVGAVEIEAFDLGFTPNAIEVDAPGRYAVTLKNTGAIPHDMTFADGTTTGTVDAGASATVEVDVPAGGLTFLCSIPGHAAGRHEGHGHRQGQRRPPGARRPRRPAADHRTSRADPERARAGDLRRDGARRSSPATSTTSTSSSTRRR